MPLFGELDLASVAERLPEMNDLDTEAWTLPGAEILQLAWEVDTEANALLPRAMHPAVPLYATLLVARYAESPVGPFSLAQLRLMGRAGAHPRGLVLGAVATSMPAAAALRERWGMPARVGTVSLRRHYDRILTDVVVEGGPAIEAALVDPEPISPADVQYIASVALAHVKSEGRPHLVQVDPHYTLHKAERGRPHVTRFEPEAWNARALRLVHPISASLTTCDTDLPRIRFVMDAEIPVVRGTRRIR
jgi:acetoacetate decarboxylase